MKTSLLLALAAAPVALCARPAAAGYTIAELRANPELPIFKSFNDGPEHQAQRLPATLTSVTAPALSATAALPAAPAQIAHLSQVPALAPAAIAETRENFEAALSALPARSPLTEPQRAAVTVIAREAFEARDIETLTRLAFLTSHERERVINRLIVEALHVFRDRVLTDESSQAYGALRTLSNSIPSDESRAWMTARIRERAASSYLAAPIETIK